MFSNAQTLNLNLRDDSGDGGVAGEKPTLLNMDPPDHTRHRGIVAQRFQLTEILKHDEPFLAAVVREILDDFMGDGGVREANFVLPAQRLSIAAVGRILGLPEEQWEQAFVFANAVAANTDPEFMLGETAEESNAAAAMGLFEIFAPLIEASRSAPQDDLVTVLANAENEREDFDFEQLVIHASLILLGGVETSRCSTIRTSSASTENRTRTWRSVWESTCVSGGCLPGVRSLRCSGNCCQGSPSAKLPVRCTGPGS